MSREQAINAYRRARNLCDRMQARLNAEILIPEFGQNYCRLHNCLVNWESGRIETDDPREHMRQAELAKLYNHQQARIWAISRRFSDHFARYF